MDKSSEPNLLKLKTCPTCLDVFLASHVQTAADLDGQVVEICDMCASEFAEALENAGLSPLDE